MVRPAAAQTVASETFIYFFRAGEFIKIGQSKRWKYRLATMQTGSPYTIVPLLVLKASPGLERQLHARFRNHRLRGEWFHRGEPITKFIKENLRNCVAKSAETDLRSASETAEDVAFDL